MHEASIVQALLDQVAATARAHGATAVRSLELRIGELAGVDPELLGLAYQTFSAGSLCDRASLHLETIPARWSCPACQAEIQRGDVLRCPDCGLPARLVAGGEILLQRIEMEVP